MNLREDSDLKAGEYVLGTLESEERAAVEARAADEPAFAAAILGWEKRLAVLHELVAPVPAPAGAWSRIAERIAKTPQIVRPRRPAFVELVTELSKHHGADVAESMVRNVRRWRTLAFTASAVVLALAALLVAEAIRRAPPPPPPPPPPMFAVLRSDSYPAPFVLEVWPEQRTVAVRSVPSRTADDRAYAIWFLPGDGEAPIALGRLRGTGVLRVDALARLSREALRSGRIAVSVEPNDAPPERPSAPFLFTGAADIP